MTNKEALEFAKKECKAYKRKVNGGFGYYQRVVDYYDIVIEALEKQIPKKPYRHDADYYVCPNCDCQVVWQWFEGYCEHCGQALDWSEEE